MTMTGEQILDLPMGPNDATAATIRDYLASLAWRVWDEGDGFNGKKPFGNGGWRNDVIAALIQGGAVKGRMVPSEDEGDESDGYPEGWAQDEVDEAVRLAIEAL